MTTAVNNWMRDEFLERDERLRGSIVVPSLPPGGRGRRDRPARRRPPVRAGAAAGAERDALGERALPRDPRGGQPEPAADHPARLGRRGEWRRPSTGTAATYYEDYLYNSQIIAPNQVLSLVAEGVFDRYPDLRVCLAELGFAWLPSLLWRFDKDWKALWRETPWVRDKPSAYVREHLRATTSPTLIPGRVPASELAQLADMLDAGHMLMYSSDYPHDHGERRAENLLAVLSEAGPGGRPVEERRRVLRHRGAGA